MALLQVAVNVLLGGTWVALGLAASLRDAKQPWAGRVAPLYASLGLVEMLRGLDQVRPGAWALPAAALLGSVAMITAHAAYVDLVEAAQFASTIRRRTAEIRAEVGTPGKAPASTEPVGRLRRLRLRAVRRRAAPGGRPGDPASAAVPGSPTLGAGTSPSPWRSSSSTRTPTPPTAPSPSTSSRSAPASRCRSPTTDPGCRPPRRTTLSARPRQDAEAGSACTSRGP